MIKQLIIWGCIGGLSWGSLIGKVYAQAEADSLLHWLIDPKPSLTQDELLTMSQRALVKAHQDQDVEAEMNVFLAMADGPLSPVLALGEGQIERLQTLATTKPLSKVDISQELGYLYFFQGMPLVSMDHFRVAYRLALPERKQLAYEALLGQATVSISEDSQQYALKCLSKALELAEDIQDTARQIQVLNQLATIQFSVGEWGHAKAFFERLLALKRQQEDTRALVSELHQVGGMFLHQGAFDRGQAFLFEALDLTVDMQDSLMQAIVLTDIGAGFIQLKDWQAAQTYALRAFGLAQKHQVSHLIGLNHRHLGEIELAAGRIEGAIIHFQAALDIFQLPPGNETEATKVRLLMASLLEAEEDYAQAIAFLQEALQHKARHSDKLSMMELQSMLGQLYVKQGEPRAAIAAMTEALRISQELRSLTGEEKAYQTLAQAYAEMGNYARAFDMQVAYSRVHDSIFTADKAKIVHSLSEKFQTAQKDQLNAELNADLLRKQAEIAERKRQNYLLFGSVVILVLGILLLWYTYVKRRQLLQEQVKTLEKEREVATLKAIIHGEEQERKRLAQELHDGLGSQLASIKMIVSSIQNEVPIVADAASHQQAEDMLDQACHEVREISHNLMPGTLARYGLLQSVRDLCLTQGQAHPLTIDCIVHGEDKDLAEEVSISVYRMLQELLRNIVKHAEAQEVLVQLEVESTHLELTVEDDGRGFNIDRTSGPAGIGLNNIRSRTSFLNGEVDVSSVPGEGTSVYISIPLSQTLNP